MRKFKILILVPLFFILFSLGVSHASANNKKTEDLNLVVKKVSKHWVTGNTNKYTKVNALGKRVKSNSKGYFRIYVEKGVRYGKVIKFNLSKNKLNKKVSARLYNTYGININTSKKAIERAKLIFSNKQQNKYHWQTISKPNKKNNYYVVMPTNIADKFAGFTGTGNFYNITKNGIIYNSDF